MNVLKDFSIGLISVLKITGAPMLYRYPYRISGEGLRADWGNIAGDIESVIGRLAEASHYEREHD